MICDSFYPSFHSKHAPRVRLIPEDGHLHDRRRNIQDVGIVDVAAHRGEDLALAAVEAELRLPTLGAPELQLLWPAALGPHGRPNRVRLVKVNHGVDILIEIQRCGLRMDVNALVGVVKLLPVGDIGVDRVRAFSEGHQQRLAHARRARL